MDKVHRALYRLNHRRDVQAVAERMNKADELVLSSLCRKEEAGRKAYEEARKEIADMLEAILKRP